MVTLWGKSPGERVVVERERAERRARERRMHQKREDRRRRGASLRRGRQARRGLRRRRMERRRPERLRSRQEHFGAAVWYGYRDCFDYIFPHPMDIVNWADDAYEMTLIRVPVFLLYAPLYYVLLLVFAVIGLPLSLLVTALRFALR